jgi:hypothetical protein
VIIRPKGLLPAPAEQLQARARELAAKLPDFKQEEQA